MKLTKTISDYRVYLAEIHKLGKKLSATQQKQLDDILRAQLILLVAFRKSSHLGEVTLNYTRL